NLLAVALSSPALRLVASNPALVFTRVDVRLGQKRTSGYVQCRLYPQKRTLGLSRAMSALCLRDQGLIPCLLGSSSRHHLQQRVRPDRELSCKRSVVSEDQ